MERNYECLKKVKISNPPLLVSWPGWRPHICSSQGTNGSARKSACHGQFHEKGKNADYRIE